KPVEAAPTRAQPLGQFVDLHTRGALFNEGLPGRIEPDLATERPLLFARGRFGPGSTLGGGGDGSGFGTGTHPLILLQPLTPALTRHLCLDYKGIMQHYSLLRVL